MAEVMKKEIREVRNLLRNRGKIDPKSAAEYAARGGFEGLKKALAMESPRRCGVPHLAENAVHGYRRGSGALHRLQRR